MKTHSMAELNPKAVKPHPVIRLFAHQALGQTSSQMGRGEVTLSSQNCAISTQAPGWFQRLKHHLLKFKHRSARSHALEDENPSTFEPFAELFLLVMNDNHIHPLIRIWYARLQWPVIQLASADPVGFQQENHPARKLIVTLGEYAQGKGVMELPCGALEQVLKQLVLNIEDASVISQAVFEEAYQAFDEFLLASRKKSPLVNCSTCLQEQQQALTIQYRKAILSTLMTVPVQDATCEFLTHVWTEILATHAAQKGLQHPDTLTLKHLAFELIQVSTDLTILSERKKAMGKVPQLVQQLRRGMAWMGITPEEQNLHIQNIGRNLSDAFMAEQATSAPASSKYELADRHPDCPPNFVPKINRPVVDGLLVSDEDTDFDWYLWECALAEQASGQPPPRQGLADIFTTPSFEDTSTDLPNFWGGYPGDSL